MSRKSRREVRSVCILAAVALTSSPAARAADSQNGIVQDFTGMEVRARAVSLSPKRGALDGSNMNGNNYAELSAEWALATRWSMEAAFGVPANYNLNNDAEQLRIMPMTKPSGTIGGTAPTVTVDRTLFGVGIGCRWR